MAVFYIDNVAQDTLTMVRGNIYRFDSGNGSNNAAPLLLSDTSDGTHGGGSTYNVGVSYWINNVETVEASYVSGFASATARFIQIEVDSGAPATLYYYSPAAANYGGEINVTN